MNVKIVAHDNDMRWRLLCTFKASNLNESLFRFEAFQKTMIKEWAMLPHWEYWERECGTART